MHGDAHPNIVKGLLVHLQADGFRRGIKLVGLSLSGAGQLGGFRVGQSCVHVNVVQLSRNKVREDGSGVSIFLQDHPIQIGQLVLRVALIIVIVVFIADKGVVVICHIVCEHVRTCTAGIVPI